MYEVKWLGSNEMYKRVYQLVENKVQNEVDKIGYGLHKQFNEDMLRTFLTDKAFIEVNRYCTNSKGIEFDRWMQRAINYDFLDFIRVRKNTIRHESYERMVNEKDWNDDASWTKPSDIMKLSTDDKYFQDDAEERLLEVWNADSLEEIVSIIDKFNPTGRRKVMKELRNLRKTIKELIKEKTEINKKVCSITW